MVRFRYFLTGCALVSGTATLTAQPYPVSPYPAPGVGVLGDADQLAQELRIVAVDPTNLAGLINAGRLSLKVGDTDGAAALYTRAERVAPYNPQVKAGMARLLVNAQRPGDALRLFAEAVQAGATERDFGPDRALAYDLIGEQERAQREYRSLLRAGPDDETIRRYALSLGISGLKDPALALLEPLNRRGDRGAWRARAFVLAMNADRRGAETIATTMMPAGMADGLKPFFDRLPKLSASDRAFAVHFGEVRGNAARYIDARRAPPLPALAAEPDPFPPRAAVQIAAVEPPAKKKKKDKRPPAVVSVGVALPRAAPLPLPPAPTALQLAALGSSRSSVTFADTASPNPGVTVLPPPADAYQPRTPQSAANLAAVTRSLPRNTADDGGDDGPDEIVLPIKSNSAPAASSIIAPRTVAPIIVPAAAPTAIALAAKPSAVQPGFTQSQILPPATQLAAAPVRVATPSAAPGSTPVQSAGNAAIASFSLPSSTSAIPVPRSFESAGTSAAAAANVAVAAPAPLGTPPVAQGSTGDAVLAAIIAGITVPASEQAVGPAPLGEAKLLTTVEKKAEAKAVVAAARVAAERPAATLPNKDTRGRYLDPRGRPLLDARGRPLGPKAAAAWALAHPSVAGAADTLPAKDKRGRYVDSHGVPLLDPRGRPLTEKAALAWQVAHPPAVGRDAAGATTLPTKDRRGRFVDDRGKPLLDRRGRPLTEKAAAAWVLAQAEDDPAKVKAGPTLPAKDVRGRFVDARGKPLLDPRGRPLTERAAAAWKLAQAKPAGDARKPADARAEPGRYWVQVAGGSNQDTLAKEWQRVSGTTAALRGKPGWTTPLKATNRVLTGPFKTSAEAMAMVNKLKGQGVAAFMFTSEPGQKITRLGTN